MPNSYFQFKHFTVHQEKAAMKICTDACLFGAWTAEKMEGVTTNNVLDIGTGTGLLSLMLAQKLAVEITAIEIDDGAAQQAKENFESSPWQERLTVLKADVRNISTENSYGLIVSNPPFYEQDLRSPDQQRNFALHSEALTFEQLLAVVSHKLSKEGFFAVLLPYARSAKFIIAALHASLFLVAHTQVRQTEKHPYFRSMLLFTKARIANETIDEIMIKIEGAYSEKFIELLKDYYLHL